MKDVQAWMIVVGLDFYASNFDTVDGRRLDNIRENDLVVSVTLF